MTRQKLLLDGTLSLFLIAACEAQQLPRSHVAASSGSLCDKEAESWGHLFSSERLDAWICSLIGSFMVGLSGELYRQVSWDSMMERRGIIKPDPC